MDAESASYRRSGTNETVDIAFQVLAKIRRSKVKSQAF